MNGEPAERAYPAESFRRILPALFLLASVFLLNFVSRVIFSPLLPTIQQDMQLAHAAAGSFFLVISSGYFVSILFSAAVSSRLGHKWTIVLSAVGSGVMLTLIGFSTNVESMRIGLFCLGYAAGLYLQSGLATISYLVPPAYLARGMAVHELAPNIGFVIAPLLCGLILQYLTWREGLQLLGVLLGCMGGIYALLGSGNSLEARRMDFSAIRGFLVIPQFWLMVILFSFAICATLGIYAMLPLYLVAEHGLDQALANKLVALSRVSAVIMPLVAGWLGDRFGNGLVMMSVLLLAGMLTVPFGFFTGYPLVAAVVLQPMVAVCFFPSGFAVLSRIGGAEVRGSAVPLCIPLAFLFGGGAIPVAIGAAGDHFSLAIGFMAIGCSTMLVAGGAFWFGRKKGLLSYAEGY